MLHPLIGVQVTVQLTGVVTLTSWMCCTLMNQIIRSAATRASLQHLCDP